MVRRGPKLVKFFCPGCQRVVAAAVERATVWCRCGCRCVAVAQQALPRAPWLRGRVRAQGNLDTAQNVQDST